MFTNAQSDPLALSVYPLCGAPFSTAAMLTPLEIHGATLPTPRQDQSPPPRGRQGPTPVGNTPPSSSPFRGLPGSVLKRQRGREEVVEEAPGGRRRHPRCRLVLATWGDQVCVA
jgi:hypothetical protein